MKTTTFTLQFLLILLFSSVLGTAQTYSTVGIIGPATPDGTWNVSVPMELQYAGDPHQWMLTVRLSAGKLKFRADNSWEVNWGNSAFPTGTGYQNGPDIPIPTAGYYTIYFNDSSGDYHFQALDPVEYETVGIIGDATANGWEASTAMTRDPSDPHSWHLESITLTTGEVKFRANNAWNVSWGGGGFPEGTATVNGLNIPVIPGTYAVTFHDITGSYSFELLNATTYQSVGIIGDATANGWEASTPMERLSQELPNDWLLTTYLNQGFLKFRANNSWEVNWGGTDFPSGTASIGGSDLSIPESGYYAIRFNDYFGTYSFTKIDTYETIGIIGSATLARWDTSSPMVQGTDGQTWTLEDFELSSGEVKFRANNSWDVNWGGTDFPEGVAISNGPNIPVEPGVYDISFNDFTREYSFVRTGSPSGQIVTLDPYFPSADIPVTIIYDATKGTGGLAEAAEVYMHAGVVLSGPEGTTWSHVVGNWGQDDGIGQMQPVVGEPGKWSLTIPSIREYFNLEAGVPVFRLAMVFRNADGSVTGKAQDGDIFIDTDPGDFVRFTAPLEQDVFVRAGESFSITAEASGVAEEIRLEIDNGSGFEPAASISNAGSLQHSYRPSASGQLRLRLLAKIGENTVSAERTLSVHVREANIIAELPEGLSSGIHYDASDPTKATLVLLAPGKEFVYLVGDFNNWEISSDYQMRQTPDGNYFWLEISDLEPQREYVFQYWVEGVIKIGDPYADKVADPYSDGNIPADVYPDPVVYTRTQDGIATVLQTGQTAYQWQFPEVVGGRPLEEDLVIYELLIRDFVASHSYQGVIDKLPYLKELGINAIELLPIMEFENNESWGYNPTYLFAPDKYYGTKNDLKALIDKAHEMGMVVLLDMVHNHQFGQSPMVRLYFDEATGKPTAKSPWFNQDATHPYNVGYDFNHESPYTQRYIDDVNRYWLEEYNFDGFRFDLSKGFTQRYNPDDVGAWSAYDQSRIDILKRMTSQIWAADPEAYVIMEHLADNDEEKVLAEFGIMLWGNMNHGYAELVLGNTGGDVSWGLSELRGWTEKNLVTYMESHDEERLMAKALQYGFSSGDYNIKNRDTALERVKLASAFFLPLPGPKMIWQFGELGYDYSIDYNGRTGNKPIPWSGPGGLGYDADPARMRLYEATAAMNKLVNENPFVFEEGAFSWTPAGQFRNIRISHPAMDVLILGNFGITSGATQMNLMQPGTWYDFFSGEAFEVVNTANMIDLSPGEFHILVNQPLDFPETDPTANTFVFISDPTELSVEMNNSFVLEISWKDNSAGESGYLLQRRGEGEQEFRDITTLPENSEAYSDASVIDGVTYEYRVKAINTSGSDSGWSATDTADLPLKTPTGLNAVLADAREVVLHWLDHSGHETSYTIERSMQYGNITTPFSELSTVTTDVSTFRDQDVRPGIQYSYRVFASDSDERSDLSNVASIRPADGLGDHFSSSITMYPNPASDMVTISSSQDLSEKVQLQLVTLEGTVVRSFVLPSDLEKVNVDVRGLPTGFYIMHETDSQVSFGKLLMIQR